MELVPGNFLLLTGWSGGRKEGAGWWPWEPPARGSSIGGWRCTRCAPGQVRACSWLCQSIGTDGSVRVCTCVHEACTSMHTWHPARLSAQPPPEQPGGFSPSPWSLLIPLPKTPNQQTAPEAPVLGLGSQFWRSAPEPSLPQTSTLGAR